MEERVVSIQVSVAHLSSSSAYNSGCQDDKRRKCLHQKLAASLILKQAYRPGYQRALAILLLEL